MTEPRSALNAALLLACTLASGAAWGQAAPLSSTASSAAERAQKESDRTMYWIRVLADKPAPTRAAPVPRPAVATVASVARPAAEVREKVRVAAAPAPAATSTAAEAASVAAVPLAVVQAAAPVQAPAGDVPDPTALSSGSAENSAVAAAATLPPEVAPAPPAEPDPGLIQVKSVQPDFPGAVVRRVHKGNVEVRFEVDPAGTVVDATVVESSHSRLNEAAVEAVKQWRFKPTPGPHTAMVNLVFDIDAEL